MARNEQLIRQHKILQVLERRRYGATLEEIRGAVVEELGPGVTDLAVGDHVVTAFVPIEDGSLASLLEFLALGSLFGSVFAVATFAIAAFSLPMIADRDVDMVTAGISSVNAVLRNKGAALVWAALIAMLTAVGLATAFVGLGIVMPWLAYAAWHGYREALDASAWPSLDADGAEPGSTRSSA